MKQLATGFYHWCILLHLAGLGLMLNSVVCILCFVFFSFWLWSCKKHFWSSNNFEQQALRSCGFFSRNSSPDVLGKMTSTNIRPGILVSCMGQGHCSKDTSTAIRISECLYEHYMGHQGQDQGTKAKTRAMEAMASVASMKFQAWCIPNVFCSFCSNYSTFTDGKDMA